MLWDKIYSLLDSNEVISITGGGGKTTFLIEFGDYLKKKGNSVLLSTTTRLASPENIDYKCTQYFYSDDIFSYKVKKGKSVFYGIKKDEKIVSPPLEELEKLTPFYDYTLLESDGSRGLPVKIHTYRDPVIIKNTTMCVSIMGLWGIGKKINDVVFGFKNEKSVDENFLKEFIKDEEGLLKGMRGKTKNIVIFTVNESVTKESIDIIKRLELPKGIMSFIADERSGEVFYV